MWAHAGLLVAVVFAAGACVALEMDEDTYSKAIRTWNRSPATQADSQAFSFRLQGLIERLRGWRFIHPDLEAIRVAFTQALSDVALGENESASSSDTIRQEGLDLIRNGSAAIDHVYDRVYAADALCRATSS